MTSTNPTIIDLKISFLRSQILALSAPLRPSAVFTTANAASPAETAIREKALDDALYKLNAQLRKHNKLVYGPQATRHVAEQIDRLYWNASDRGIRGGVGDDEKWRELNSDFREAAVVEQLPEEYSSKAAERAPEAAAKFTELSSKLKELAEKRKETKTRLEAYRKLRGLVDAFGEDGGIQDNIVTKNGEVEKELERMRMLMLRVERGMEGVERSKETNDHDDMEWENGNEQALQIVLQPHS